MEKSGLLIYRKPKDGKGIVVDWNFKKGDRWGFAVVLGEYYLEKDKPASVTISNTGADGFIVADGIGFIKIE